MKQILFNTEMSLATLEDRKTATRRVIKFTGKDIYGAACLYGKWNESYDQQNLPEELVEWYVKNIAKPKYRPGDILYVRETFCELPVNPDGSDSGKIAKTYYKADGDLRPDGWRDQKWRPSIHMPQEAARIFLRVTDVRVERLQAISIDSCIKEGVNVAPSMRRTARNHFIGIWNSTVKVKDLAAYGWDANPWVWVIKFERISKEEAARAEKTQTGSRKKDGEPWVERFYFG